MKAKYLDEEGFHYLDDDQVRRSSNEARTR